MTRKLAAGTDVGLNDGVMLIGDPEYYGRFFDFTADCTKL